MLRLELLSYFIKTTNLQFIELEVMKLRYILHLAVLGFYIRSLTIYKQYSNSCLFVNAPRIEEQCILAKKTLIGQIKYVSHFTYANWKSIWILWQGKFAILQFEEFGQSRFQVFRMPKRKMHQTRFEMSLLATWTFTFTKVPSHVHKNEQVFSLLVFSIIVAIVPSPFGTCIPWVHEWWMNVLQPLEYNR